MKMFAPTKILGVRIVALHRLTKAFVLVLLSTWAIPVHAEAPSATARPDYFNGMVQFSRSDGLMMFMLVAWRPDFLECKEQVEEAIDGFINSDFPPGVTGQVDAAFCTKHVPKITEFGALRYGTPTTHVIFFTPNIRMMFVHPDGGVDYEKASCEIVRGAFLSKLNLAGKCVEPRNE